MPRRLEIEDLDKFVMASHPQLSPNGESLAYVVTRGQEDAYVPTLYLVDPKDGSHRMYWEKARSPIWSPDGARLAFVSNRGLKEGDKGAEIWVIAISGEPRLVCKAPGESSSPSGAATGRRSTTSAIWVMNRRTLELLSICHSGSMALDERITGGNICIRWTWPRVL